MELEPDLYEALQAQGLVDAFLALPAEDRDYFVEWVGHYPERRRERIEMLIKILSPPLRGST